MYMIDSLTFTLLDYFQLLIIDKWNYVSCDQQRFKYTDINTLTRRNICSGGSKICIGRGNYMWPWPKATNVL